jgi:hypothetical protein
MVIFQFFAPESDLFYFKDWNLIYKENCMTNFMKAVNRRKEDKFEKEKGEEV